MRRAAGDLGELAVGTGEAPGASWPNLQDGNSRSCRPRASRRWRPSSVGSGVQQLVTRPTCSLGGAPTPTCSMIHTALWEIACREAQVLMNSYCGWHSIPLESCPRTWHSGNVRLLQPRHLPWYASRADCILVTGAATATDNVVNIVHDPGLGMLSDRLVLNVAFRRALQVFKAPRTPPHGCAAGQPQPAGSAGESPPTTVRAASCAAQFSYPPPEVQRPSQRGALHARP